MSAGDLCDRTVVTCPKTEAQVQENWDILQDALACICDIVEGVSCVDTNAALVTIENTYTAYFDQVDAQSVFSVDTGIAGLVVGDVKNVEFVYNGAVQPNTDLLPNATTALGSDYSGVSINATSVEITTSQAIGEAIENDWATLKVTISRTLKEITGC